MAVAMPLARGGVALFVSMAFVMAACATGGSGSNAASEAGAVFDYDAEADLGVRLHSVDEPSGEYRRTDLDYISPGGGRVPAYLYEPYGQGPHAAVLLMHGSHGTRESVSGLAVHYAELGAVVLAINAPFARPDGSIREFVSFTEEDRDDQIQLIQDLRRGIDLLGTLPAVDMERIGYVGFSYGAAVGGLLAGTETRPTAYVLVVGDGGLVAHFSGSDDPVPPRGVSQEQWDAWLAWMEPIEPIHFVAEAEPAHLLFQNGRWDRAVPVADAERYQEAGSEPKTILWYDVGHVLAPEMLSDQTDWLAQRIGL